ncbi:MAG: ABC transporter ATP-binding protein/permease [Arcobacteraceae bacterium]|nr:ABC transporter ATP-binding protein/permease [Arcobacteraceae bacterium]
MKQFFKQYIPYYKNYKRQFFFALIGMIMVALGTSGTAYVIKPVLDEIFINKDETMLQVLPLVVVFLYALKGFGGYIQTYYISFIGSDIIRVVRDKFLSHILVQDIKFFHEKHGGELLSRVTNDISAIQAAVSSHIAVIIMEIFTIIALVFVVIYQSPMLAFYGLVILPVIIYPLSLLAKKMKKLSHETQEKVSLLTSILSEIFNNVEIIIANNSQKKQSEDFQKINKEYFQIGIKGVKTNALVSPLMEIVGAMAAATVIAIGGMEVIKGNMTVGSFFSFMTALFMLYTPIKRLSTVYNKFQGAIAANERINDIFSQKNEIIEGKDNLQEDIQTISFENIALKYGDKIALKDINLIANKGEKIALVGDSGGGKSSLVNLILRFYDPYNGVLYFNNKDISTFTFKSLRDNISIVTQRVYIFNDTVANNIAFGEVMDEKKVKDALEQAHALAFVEKLENGIYTNLDEFGSNLSGGQRQRIAIARALYKKPQILIFDEATSALDNESESIITKVLDEVSADKITFVIAHRLSTIKNADKIIVFKDGQIICKGNEESLLEGCEEYKRLHAHASM